ncbi:hypothetical protein TcCL_NonESM02447 [Trypanosoma cruzi]|nr:hypothetical protein TcCL_NonESM02447 [Trypanosoma cruzi]
MSMDALTDVSKTTAQRDRSVAATYTPEEQVFHRLFHQIPLSEKLVESRQCALLTKKKKFARMGTLYASSLRLCFSSSFLKEPVMMRWEDVISVKKGTSFLFEAIFVKTKGQEEYIFFWVFCREGQAKHSSYLRLYGQFVQDTPFQRRQRNSYKHHKLIPL